MVRARPTSDAAYRPTNYSDLVASWDEASTHAKEVLLGLRLSIIMPEGDCDQTALEDCLTLAAIASPIKLVELARNEVEDYLTVHEKCGLEKGHPVLFHHLIDRQRIGRGRGRPRLTDRLNRLADARQFMIGQALHHLGHLLAGEPLSGADQAFLRSGSKVIGDWWPSGLAGRKAPNALYDKLLTTLDAANHVSIYSKFLPPGTKAIDQILEVYRDFDFAKDAVEKATAYWLTILRAGLLIEDIAKAQLNAHIRLSKTRQDKEYDRSDIMNFIRANSSRPSLDDILPVAYYGVSDLGHIARWTSGLHNIYESAAAVGEIARGQRARVSQWQAALLSGAFDETQHPDPAASVGPPQYLSAFAFLRAAMTRARDASWWQSVLTSARVDNYGARHIALTDEPALSAVNFHAKPGNPIPPNEVTPLTLQMMQVAPVVKYPKIHLFEHHPSSRLFGSFDSGEIWVDLAQHTRFGSDASVWLEDSVAQALSQMAIENREGRRLHLHVPTSPHCSKDHISLAVAASELLHRLGANPLPHYELNIRACARLLSDAEAYEAAQRGLTAVAVILMRLGVRSQMGEQQLRISAKSWPRA